MADTSTRSQQLRDEYLASHEPRLVRTTRASFLAIDGEGPPDGALFRRANDTLWRVAKRVQDHAKQAGTTFDLEALEALWWSDDGRIDETTPDQWQWRLMVRVPQGIPSETLEAAHAEVMDQGGDRDLAFLVHLDALDEGTVAQNLHVGPFQAVGAAYERLFRFVGREGFRMDGPVHEIYLDDPKVVPTDELRTVCRVPVVRSWDAAEATESLEPRHNEDAPPRGPAGVRSRAYDAR